MTDNINAALAQGKANKAASNMVIALTNIDVKLDKLTAMVETLIANKPKGRPAKKVEE